MASFLTLGATWLLLCRPSVDAFVPSSRTPSRTGSVLRMATMNVTESHTAARRPDPFINDFLNRDDLSSSGSRFVRYDKKKDSHVLCDTKLDDFINRCSGTNQVKYGHGTKRGDNEKISSLDGSLLEGAPNFERYDKKKFGSLIVGDKVPPKDAKNSKEGAGQKVVDDKRKVSGGLELDGIQYERFNRKKAQKKPIVPKQDDFVTDPVHASKILKDQETGESRRPLGTVPSPKARVEPPPVKIQPSVKAPSIQTPTGQYHTPGGANMTQYISAPKRPESVVAPPFRVRPTKDPKDRPPFIHEGIKRPVRPSPPEQSQASVPPRPQAKKPVLPPLSPSLLRPLQQKQDQPSVMQSASKTSFAAMKSTPGVEKARTTSPTKPAPPQAASQKPAIPVIPPLSPSLLRPLTRQQAKAPLTTTGSTGIAAMKSPPVVWENTGPTLPQGASRTPAIPKRGSSSVASPPTTESKRPRPTKVATSVESLTVARQKMQAQRNRDELVRNYHSFSDEELLMYGMKSSVILEPPPEASALFTATSVVWDSEEDDASMEDELMDSFQEYSQSLQVAMPAPEDPTLFVPDPLPEQDTAMASAISPQLSSSVGNDFVQLGDASGFGGFSLADDSTSSTTSTSGNWWQRTSWDGSKETVIRDFSGEDDALLQSEGQEDGTTVVAQESDGDDEQPKSPGFMGFSSIDWSQRR